MDQVLSILKARFEKNGHRHVGLNWADIEARLLAAPEKLKSLSEMEATGGEPDVIGQDESGAYIYCDCAPESPTGRRSLCYDDAAHASRKEHKPAGSALGLAQQMGIEILSEDQYRALQALESVDKKTSSWVLTPEPIRQKGGAIFCDRRYDHVFTYHNGAESYYAVRGFRGRLKL